MSSPTSQTVSPIDQEIEKKQRIVFIFNDMLIIAKALSQEPNRLEKGKLKLIEKREFSDVEVDSGTETKGKLLLLLLLLLFFPFNFISVIFIY